MNSLFFILCALVVLVLVFYAGIIVGIADCKRRFQVPKGAVGVDKNGACIYR